MSKLKSALLQLDHFQQILRLGEYEFFFIYGQAVFADVLQKRKGVCDVWLLPT